MGQTVRRILRTLGFWGVLGLMFVALAVACALFSTGLESGVVTRVVTLMVAGLGASARQWGTYQRSVETDHYTQVLPDLMASRDEFCLLLRPFGSDGEVLLRDRPDGWLAQRDWVGTVRPTMTLEQVVAGAVRATLGVRSYAIVDQGLQLAPPGPVYLRASDQQWQRPAGELIRRAHTIAILLPPNQGLRRALEWELQQIVHRHRASRVVIVLPPFDRRRYDYSAARRQACVLLAALEGPPVTFAEVSTFRVEELLEQMPENVLVAKRCENGEVSWWMSERGPGRVGSRVYADCLRQAVAENEQEVVGLGFAARYGYSVAGGNDRPVRPWPVGSDHGPGWGERMSSPPAILMLLTVLVALPLPFITAHRAAVERDRPTSLARPYATRSLSLGDLGLLPSPAPTVDTGTGTDSDPGFDDAPRYQDDHSCVIAKAGGLWCEPPPKDDDPAYVSPQLAGKTRIGRDRWRSVSVGAAHTCGIQSNRSLRCWGDNDLDQLGRGILARGGTRPRAVAGGGRWLSVAAVSDLTCAVRTDHTLWCWGMTDFEPPEDEPGPVSSDVPQRVGRLHGWRSAAVEDGEICVDRPGVRRWCW